MSLDDREIRPPLLIEQYEKLYQTDLTLLLDKLVEVNCPACNRNDYQLKYKKMSFTFVQCNECKTVYVNPRPVEKNLEKFYTTTNSSKFWDKIFSETKEIRIEKIFRPRIKLVTDILKQYDLNHCETMIEVGAGYGWFCELAKEQKLARKIIAVEPSPICAQICKKINGIQVIKSTIEKNFDKLNSDLIVTFETIHLLFNPAVFLKECYTSLKKNGVLIFTITNYFGLDIQILQEKSNYIIPTFLNLFNPNSIELLLKTIGFRNVVVLTPGLMDVKIILNYIKEGKVNATDYPFFKFLMETNNDDFITDLQHLLQKHKMSSHMLVAAQK